MTEEIIQEWNVIEWLNYDDEWNQIAIVLMIGWVIQSLNAMGYVAAATLSHYSSNSNKVSDEKTIEFHQQ